MSDPPIFLIEQPGGQPIELDLSTAGQFGDFAFTATDPATGDVTFYDAYHTGERFIFLDVLHRIAHQRPTQDVLDDLVRVRADLAERTDGLNPTSRSEHDFTDLLPRWLATLNSEPTDRPYTASSDRLDNLTLTPTDDGLTITRRRGDTPRPRDPAVHIPTGELWRFAAGMIWRSYEQRRDAPFLTRASTTAYQSALDAFESTVTVGRATP